jgi:hypothetical protein
LISPKLHSSFIYSSSHPNIFCCHTQSLGVSLLVFITDEVFLRYLRKLVIFQSKNFWTYWFIF